MLYEPSPTRRITNMAGRPATSDLAGQLLESRIGNSWYENSQEPGAREADVLHQVLVRRQHIAGGGGTPLRQTVCCVCHLIKS